MPKIKDLANRQLEDYLSAYQSHLSSDNNNQEYVRKVKCIELALKRRDLINYDLVKLPKKGFFGKIFSLFSKKK